MAYKYAFMRKLAQKIRDNEIPEDLDIDEVLEFWYKHNSNSPVVKYEPWKNKPQFYNRAQSANTRAKKVGASGIVTHDILNRVFERYNKQCAKCGKKEHLVFDHIVPYYRGGTNTEDNLQVLCRICNMEKGVN